jgi:hypothetical protein
LNILRDHFVIKGARRLTKLRKQIRLICQLNVVRVKPPI